MSHVRVLRDRSSSRRPGRSRHDGARESSIADLDQAYGGAPQLSSGEFAWIVQGLIERRVSAFSWASRSELNQGLLASEEGQEETVGFSHEARQREAVAAYADVGLLAVVVGVVVLVAASFPMSDVPVVNSEVIDPVTFWLLIAIIAAVTASSDAAQVLWR